MVTGSSVEVLLTVKVKITLPPVSGTAVGLAVLVTSMVGRTLVKSTVASSVSVASVLSLSTALAGEDVDVVRAGEVALDPLVMVNVAGGAGGQDGADLAVGVAGQGAVDRVAQAGDGDRLLGAGVLAPRR